MIERLPARLAGAGPLADYVIGTRVQTREGYPGVITDIHEGPADLTTYWVTLDNGMGGGEYAEAEIWPVNTTPTTAAVSVEGTAAEDYPELGTILHDRLPPKITAAAAAQMVREALSTQVAIPSFTDAEVLAQFTQYPQETTFSGIKYFKGEISSDMHVDCLLAYRSGQLIGVLNHFPKDMGPERKGNVLLLVHPDFRRQGIGTALWREAKKRWNVTATGQDQTPEGAAFTNKVGHLRETTSAINPSPLCNRCFISINGWEPEMGDQTSFAPGVCSNCGESQIVFTLTDDFVLGKKADKTPNPDYDEDARAGTSDSYEFIEDDDLNWPSSHLLLTPEQRAEWLKRSLYLPPKADGEISSRNESLTPNQRAGYQAGLAHGKAGVTRTYASDDPDYRIGYDLGWAEGVEVGREPASSWDRNPPEPGHDLTFTTSRQPQTMLDLHRAQYKQGATWLEILRGKPSPGDGYTSPDRFTSFDWCRFRREQHCWLPKGLDEEASKAEGYAVWIPEDRGHCPRVKWDDQKICPTGEPGPNSGSGGFTDATVPYEQGGQRGGIPSPFMRNHTGSLAAVADMHFTASWKDVKEKAKRIRQGGGVRIFASNHGTLTAHVRGDTGVYETELVRNPGKRNVAYWHCGCRWGSYSWGRSGPWKKFEGRMCSHALALQYEAQSRNMFGRELTLDEKQPEWMDPTIPVRRPGDYDKDKGRYSVLRMQADWHDAMGALGQKADLDRFIEAHDQGSGCDDIARAVEDEFGVPQVWGYVTVNGVREPHSWNEENGRIIDASRYVFEPDAPLLASRRSDPAFAAYSRPVDYDTWEFTGRRRPIVEQHEDDPNPVVMLAYAMQLTGARYADIRKMVLSAGGDPVTVSKQARSETFKAKVRGMVQDLLITLDGFFDTSGREVAVKDIVYPGWDPVKGLNWRTQASLAIQVAAALQRTAKPLDDPALREADTFEEAADAILRQARAEERVVTPYLMALAERFGGDMPGLEHRFKTKGSLVDKMRREHLNAPPGQVAASMSDVLRYTMMLPFESYTKVTKQVLADLAAKGYRKRVKNYWGRGDAYNGVNAALISPRTEFPLELQFHTLESVVTKEQRVHPVYKRWQKTEDPNTKAILGTKMRDMYDMVHRPPGALGITERKRQPMVPHNQIQWFPRAAALDDGYRYYRLHDPYDNTTGFARANDASSQVLLDGEWVEDPAYGRYNFLGETGSDEISPDQFEALRGAVAAMVKTADEDQCPVCSGDALMSNGEYVCQDCGHHFPEPTTDSNGGSYGEFSTKTAAISDRDWQTGRCGTYAVALIQMDPFLRFGVAGKSQPDGSWWPQHYFAHDDFFVYDSLGRHQLSGYHGLSGLLDHVEVNQKPDDWGIPDDEDTGTLAQDLEDAKAHATAHRVLGSTTAGVTEEFESPATPAHHAGFGDDPSYEFDPGVVWVGPNGPSVSEWGFEVPDDTIDEDPEAALPVTYGDEEEGHDSITIAGSAGGRADSATYKAAEPPTYNPEKTAAQIAAALHAQAGVESTQRFAEYFTEQDLRGIGQQVADDLSMPAEQVLAEYHDKPLPQVKDYSTMTNEEKIKAAEIMHGTGSPQHEKAKQKWATSDEARDWGTPREDMEPGETFVDPPYAEETPERKGARLLAEHTARMAAIKAGVEPTGPDPFAHLLAGQDSADVQAAAQQFLAKQALKTYTPAERQQIIDEGIDVEAGNLDALDISGTHYEALDQARGKASSLADADDLWMIDGDGNE